MLVSVSVLYPWTTRTLTKGIWCFVRPRGFSMWHCVQKQWRCLEKKPPPPSIAWVYGMCLIMKMTIISGFSRSAWICHAVLLMALQHYYPWSLGLLFHSWNHLSSLGVYMYVAHHVIKSITRIISALTGTHLPLGKEKQLQSHVLLMDTSVMTGFEPTLW